MTSYAAPSGGSASDDWTKPGRTRSKARSIARADDPADSALRHGSVDTKDLVPELGAQAAAPPGSDEFTALQEQLATVQAEADATKADTFGQLGDLNAKMDALFELFTSRPPATLHRHQRHQRRLHRRNSRLSRSPSSASTNRPPSTRPSQRPSSGSQRAARRHRRRHRHVRPATRPRRRHGLRRATGCRLRRRRRRPPRRPLFPTRTAQTAWRPSRTSPC